MTPAEHVISKFGSQSALARLLRRGRSTIQHWATSGTIPAKWQAPLLKLAEEQGIGLSPSDFLPPPVTGVAEIVLDDLVANLPTAKWMGFLQIGEVEIPCYVLDDDRRVISRTGATGMLTNTTGGNLERYLSRKALENYIAPELIDQMVDFNIPEVANKTVRGISAETFLEICRAYVKARDEGALQTESQISIAIRAGVFLSACAKVGLIALIDEATGYQYERAQDALKLKLKIYLEEEMRKWEKTFPDELWREFARLTKWKGSVTQRPKYWGKLVMELVYEYLDQDVALWLKENAPKPRGGKNYHQWLSSQYGLKKLLEHLWMLIGMASACYDMPELRQRMAEKYGRSRLQLTLYLPPPNTGGGQR